MPQLLVVPYTGHSVFGTTSAAARRWGSTAFFSGQPVQACAPAANIFTPTPITPRTLNRWTLSRGFRPAGRTLTAVLDTILDLNRQVIGATLQANQALPSGSSFGGLRGGYAQLVAARCS